MDGQAPDGDERIGWWRPTSVLGRARLGLLAGLVVLTAGAWALTLLQAASMTAPAEAGGGMAGMDMPATAGMGGARTAEGWSPAAAAVFVATWTVMMAAMMLPAAAPMILVFAGAQARRARAVAVPTWIFVAGYLLVWMLAGVVVHAAAQLGRGLTARLGPEVLAGSRPVALGAILVAAGLYQFTPLKRVCLAHCRSPLAFVARHWREGRGGALLMGLRHGAYCLGCCWALFAVLAAAGVMSLAWMLLLTLVVFVEKTLPFGAQAAPVIGLTLVAFGLMVAAAVLPMP